MNEDSQLLHQGERDPETGVDKACDKKRARAGLVRVGLWVLLAAAAFHGAYASSKTSWLVLFYLFSLLQLAQADTWRQAFYSGLTVGLLIALGRLGFFWNIFSGGAGALWLIYAFWVGLFVALARLCRRRFPRPWAWLLIPFLWIGLEYFRSELYYLRFSWLNPGYTFAGAPWQTPLPQVGVYGMGFVLISVAGVSALVWRNTRLASLAVLGLGVAALGFWGFACAAGKPSTPASTVRIAGVQMEFPSDEDVLSRLDELLRKLPQTELIVLSEYTFDGPIPQAIKSWCSKNKRYLVIGGKDPAPNGSFYDTAFVIGPSGEIVFRQGKAVPIQFFKDGLPAPEQKLWDSPWGKIGLCVCYDLSYTRVTDRLVKLGAQALIVPTMDVIDWGQAQHELHARVAPIRAAEYGLPIFRVASSGISQFVDQSGRVIGSAPCPGEGEIISGTLELRGPGRLPLDRWLGPFAAGLTGVSVLWCSVRKGRKIGAETSFCPHVSASASSACLYCISVAS